MRDLAMVACGLALITGCATGYGGDWLGRGGAEATWVGENILMVSAKGNGYTDDLRISEMTLLRAAEESLSKGFPFFTLASTENTGRTELITTPGVQTTTLQGNTARTTGGDLHTNVYFPGRSSTFRMFAERPANLTEGEYFDSAFIYNSLGPKFIKNFTPLLTVADESGE